MAHPNITHVDDVEAEVVEVGELRGRWRDLGSAAGSFRAGVSLIEIAPGARSTPAHTHADEEELFYVLDGDGRFWQNGQTFAIEAGDCLLHRVHEESHTLIAGDGGLTVLAFGPRAATNITWLGHARVMRVGPNFLPHDVEPYDAEAAAGPLPVPDVVSAQRPPTIAALADVPPSEHHRGRVRQKIRPIGGARASPTTSRSIPTPGRSTCAAWASSGAWSRVTTGTARSRRRAQTRTSIRVPVREPGPARPVSLSCGAEPAPEPGLAGATALGSPS
jgi:uncharacterized cupin superfamily protein